MKNIETYLREEIAAAIPGGLPHEFNIELEIPRDAVHGDLSTNIALRLAKYLKTAPTKIADSVCKNFRVDTDYIDRIDFAGPGFINFTYSRKYLHEIAQRILDMKSDYGACYKGNGLKVNLEFVSANPTGPLNVVSARAAALGDSLKRILNKCGYQAFSEFYINDAGKQIQKLGHSLLVRCAEKKGIEGIPFPEDGYHGDYVKDFALGYTPSDNIDWKNIDDELMMEAGSYAVEQNCADQKKNLSEFKVEFDAWVRESSIRESNGHLKIKDKLITADLTYEKEGALYFKSTAFGDVEDRVIWTSDERPTYLLPDIAYHQNKYDRGFEFLVDIWGPDHHGYIARMKAALQALGHDEESFNVIIAQQVNLVRSGEIVKMSKRAGDMVTMKELIDEVGVDAARFFFLQRKPSAHLDFDIDLAVKETDENPVFYIQYAHARICSIERLAEEENIPNIPVWETLSEEGEYNLIRKLAEFPSVVEVCARTLEPQRMTVYLQDLASAFHGFYQKHRVITADSALSSARLGICRAVRWTIFSGLQLLGVSAPERM